jgi:hypothetical protein
MVDRVHGSPGYDDSQRTSLLDGSLFVTGRIREPAQLNPSLFPNQFGFVDERLLAD